MPFKNFNLSKLKYYGMNFATPFGSNFIIAAVTLKI
jgi:hypothetical protein